MRTKMWIATVVLALVACSACGKKGEHGDKADKADKATGSELATVDCDKFLTHMGDVVVAETKKLQPEKVDTLKKKLADGHTKAIAECETQQKDESRTMTQKQYDCVMGASALDAVKACMQ